ncbi:MAG TPA: DmsE family decaheme c-type cytochrome [Candidatus Acidoferrales bacterium]|jgi:DmsE family decaheme c-type cytochrome|nr:DmsE family decaheme c-type cytochrome [Candidatus Acidoferrales bacterium]
MKVSHVLLLSLLFSIALTLAAPAGAQQDKPAPPAPPAAAESPYAGSDTCKTCHEEVFNSWEKSPHWKITLLKENHVAGHGCESCHGPGAAHASDPGDATKIFSFNKATPEKVNEHCLDCHAKDTEHANAVRSVHARNKVSCIDCHSPHHAATEQFLLVKTQPQLCYTCHLAKRPQFEMPFHHRVNEGLVQCTDCHNPHGTVRPNQLRSSAAQDVPCFKCHTDKQGPFVFEHEVVKVEGCQTCHTPHGSPNPHLLKLSNVNLLCLSCHTTSFANAPGAPSFHNQSAQFQACTLCHTQIHGSNFSPVFFK